MTPVCCRQHHEIVYVKLRVWSAWSWGMMHYETYKGWFLSWMWWFLHFTLLHGDYILPNFLWDKFYLKFQPFKSWFSFPCQTLLWGTPLDKIMKNIVYNKNLKLAKWKMKTVPKGIFLSLSKKFCNKVKTENENRVAWNKKPDSGALPCWVLVSNVAILVGSVGM